jgi:hypothetical protein
MFYVWLYLVLPFFWQDQKSEFEGPFLRSNFFTCLVLLKQSSIFFFALQQKEKLLFENNKFPFVFFIYNIFQKLESVYFKFL